MNYEFCRENLDKLISFYSENETKRNEATTRLHLIDTIFFDCLGWSKENCILEENHDRQYRDYTFKTSRRVLIVEAKKENEYFDLPAGISHNKLSIISICRDYPNIKKAISQVSEYCQKAGVSIACICNGHQLIAFLASRNDGVPPLSGVAIVYQSLSSMAADFKNFWDYLSRNGIIEGRLEKTLLGKQDAILPSKLSSSIKNYPGIKGRNPFQSDLKIVTDLVLEDLNKNPEFEKEFLKECYCQSGALSQYALIKKELSRARYLDLFDENTPSPALMPAKTKKGITLDVMADSLSERPILLIGDIGVGKTTFIRHMIKVEPLEVFGESFPIYIDFGKKASLTLNLKEFVLDEIQRQLLELYNTNIHSRGFVFRVYKRQIEQFRNSIYGDLYETDKKQYIHEQIKTLNKLVSNNEQHLKESISHIRKEQNRSLVIFLDNADQRSDDVQQEIFLMAQELAETWKTTVFVALRPETFYNSLQRGALTGYHAKAYTVSPPRIDRVIDKRLAFGLKLAAGDLNLGWLPEQIKVRFHKLEAIMKAFQQSLNYSGDIMEAIDNISGGNVRRALDFVTGFFGSGHVDTRKIIEIYEDTGFYYVPIHEFLRAVIFGDAAYYDPYKSPISNLLDVSSNDLREHFLLPIALKLIRSSTNIGGSGFVETSQIYEILQQFGFNPSQIDFALMRAYDKRLIETVNRQVAISDNEVVTSIRISTIGIYHLERLLLQFQYVDAIVIDTPIFSKVWRDKILDDSDILDRIERARLFIGYLDEQWQKAELNEDVFDWPSISDALYKSCAFVKGKYEDRQRRKESNL